ncbi:MAG: phosphoribosylformylglycinamidine synthase subunit PurQ [bacterium]
MSTAVVVFPGSNCEKDTLRAVEAVSGRPATLVWHKDRLPSGTRLAVLPGGFSYGDYLRAGAIARFSPVMKSVIELAKAGGLVLGICNGFQILLEARLLPGAMIRNRNLHFICRWINLRIERPGTPFTNFNPRILRIPIAHAMGNYFIDGDGLKQLEARGQVIFRYCSQSGDVGDAHNPNGSAGSIAGICNEAGNVLGMMPHPERAIDEALGSVDGRCIWESVLKCGG